jgi:hypothetical protein
MHTCNACRVCVCLCADRCNDIITSLLHDFLLQPAPGLASYTLGQKDHYIWALRSDIPGSDIYNACHDIFPPSLSCFVASTNSPSYWVLVDTTKQERDGGKIVKQKRGDDASMERSRYISRRRDKRDELGKCSKSSVCTQRQTHTIHALHVCMYVKNTPYMVNYYINSKPLPC